MKHHKDIFEVAIYRVAPATWSADAEERVKAYEDWLLTDLEKAGVPADDGQRFRARQFAEYVERPYRWDYNEIIAWVRIIWDGPGPVIKAYLSQVGKKSLLGGRTRRHYQRGFIAYPFVHGEPVSKTFETWLSDDMTDFDIYSRIRALLCGVTDRRGDLPGRHIDLRVFDAIGPHIQWRRVVTP